MENGQQVVTPEMNRMQTSGGGGVVDPEKEKFIQFQLFLLLHANRCLKNVATNEPNPCTVLHCSTMINVLQHMNTCIEGKRCKFAHCASSRQIISHWKQCKREDCSVCLPLRKPPSINGPTSIPSPQPTIPEEGVNNPIPSQQMERQPYPEDNIDQTHVSNQPDDINSEQNNTTPVINRHCVGYALLPYPRRSFLARRKLSAKRKAHITRSSNSWDVRDVRRVRFAPKYRTVTRISAKCMQCHMTDTNNLLGQWIDIDL